MILHASLPRHTTILALRSRGRLRATRAPGEPSIAEEPEREAPASPVSDEVRGGDDASLGWVGKSPKCPRAGKAASGPRLP